MPALTRRRRTTPPGDPQAITAAASRVRINTPGTGKTSTSLGKPRDWQPRCVQAARLVGEVGAVADFYSGVMSKLRLFVGAVGEGEMPDPLPDPTEDQDDQPAPAVTLPTKLVNDANDILDRIRPFLPSLLFNLEWNTWTQGEAFILGRDGVIDENLTTDDGQPITAETWEVRVRAELKVSHGKLTLEEPGKKPVPLGTPEQPDVFMLRVWRPDPEHPSLPDSSVRRVLDRCEQMEILDRAINATALARLSNAGLMVWDRRVIPPRGDMTQDQLLQTFQDDVTNALTQAVGDPGAASAVAPFHVFVDLGEDRTMPQHFEFQRVIDEYLANARKETLQRIAQGLNAAPERVFGLADATHWNAFLVTEDEWKSYLEPDAVLLITSLTIGLLRPLLVQLYGHSVADVQMVGFGYDAGHIVVRPNRAADALTLHKEFVLSDAALLEAHGFDGRDVASPEERAWRLALVRGAMDPYLTQAVLTEYGELPGLVVERPVGPTGGGYEPTRESDPAPTPGVPQSGPAPGSQAAVRPLRLAVTAAASGSDAGRELGRRLLAVDRETRTRLHGACEAAMRAALARFGSKLAAKTRGKTDLAAAITDVPDLRIAATLGQPVVAQLNVAAPDPSWFTDLADLADRQLSAASSRAVAILADYLGADPTDLADLAATLEAARPVAVRTLITRLTALLNDRLFTPDPQTDVTAPGEIDPAALVPAGLLRGVMALAGGWPLEQVDTATGLPVFSVQVPVTGLAFGQAAWSTLDDAGESISGYLWSYGDAPRNPFEPHLALDGVEGDEPTADVFVNDEGWPYSEWFAPGDHDGCVCDWQPVLAGDAQGAYARGALPPDFAPTEGAEVPDESVVMPPGLQPPHPVAASVNGARR